LGIDHGAFLLMLRLIAKKAKTILLPKSQPLVLGEKVVLVRNLLFGIYWDEHSALRPRQGEAQHSVPFIALRVFPGTNEC
jgi:hypothetical protein